MDIKYLKHEKYLEVIFTGERSFAALSDSIEQVYKECQKNNINKILVDISRAKGHWEEFDRFKIGEKISQLYKWHYKILTVEKENKINKFVENTAVNRGVNLLVTHDKKEGLDWLLKDN
jgi:hypothetical protein